MQVIVLPDAASLAEYAAAAIANGLHPGSNLALSGGGTPAATYLALRSLGVDWTGIDLWLGDERWVPMDDPDSNAGAAMGALGGSAMASLLPIPWHAEVDPAVAADQYEALLRVRLSGKGDVIRPGIVLLGIGDDCHTASLFPGTRALEVTDRDFVANWVEEKGVWRLTATLPLLHRSEKILFLVQGEGKAAALREILEGEAASPASRVAAGAEDVTWITDESAAHLLASTPCLRP
jgi:6-phosphogluconolactonase